MIFILLVDIYHQVDDMLFLPVAEGLDIDLAVEQISDLYFCYLDNLKSIFGHNAIEVAMVLTGIYHGFFDSETQQRDNDANHSKWHKLREEEKCKQV